MAGEAEYTVVFYGHPRNIKGNPFDLVTDFGRVVVLSISNLADEADCFREALEEIAESDFGKSADIAQAALDAADARTTKALEVRRAAATAT